MQKLMEDSLVISSNDAMNIITGRPNAREHVPAIANVLHKTSP